jgi:hypothetical protein
MPKYTPVHDGIAPTFLLGEGERVTHNSSSRRVEQTHAYEAVLFLFFFFSASAHVGQSLSFSAFDDMAWFFLLYERH